VILLAIQDLRRFSVELTKDVLSISSVNEEENEDDKEFSDGFIRQEHECVLDFGKHLRGDVDENVKDTGIEEGESTKDVSEEMLYQ
ncbi:10749_t:CDS:2, partial [Funneliformis geosporum]